LSAILKYTDRGSKYFEVFGPEGTGQFFFVKSAVTSASSSDRLRRSIVCRGKLTCIADSEAIGAAERNGAGLRDY